ncbi:hypothetical protein HKD37_06G017133 [Glycine soja]
MHSEAEALEHMKKRDTGHQSVSLENKIGDSTVLKIGNSAKVVIKQDMKGRRHKYGFNNNKREKAEKVRVVDDETGDKHQLDKLLAEKTKKKLEEAAQSGSVDGVINPPSSVRRHVKWKIARTKKIGEMTTEAAKEIAEKIDSFEEQATQGSFIPHGRQDVLTAAIGRPEHPRRVCAIGAGVTIKQYFGSAPRTSRSSSSLPPEKLQ